MPKKTHKTSVGGQALIEGVMMRGPKGMATAVRKPDGEILTEYHEVKRLGADSKFLKLPLVRGIVAFIESMMTGYKCLMYSAEVSGMEDLEEAEMSKFEQWLTDKLGDKLMSIITGIATVLGFALAFYLFAVMPTQLFGLINKAGNLTMFRGLFEGVLKIIIFVAYMLLVSQMKDIKRVFKYHGAEHKSICCYEQGMELTVENVKKCTRFHPRCGTSFIFVMLILSIIVVSLLSFVVPEEFKTGKLLMVWVLLKLLCVPVIMGLGYEFIRYAGRNDNLLVTVLSAPGLWMQRITTKEPEDDIIECGIASLQAVITENPEDDEIK